MLPSFPQDLFFPEPPLVSLFSSLAPFISFSLIVQSNSALFLTHIPHSISLLSKTKTLQVIKTTPFRRQFSSNMFYLRIIQGVTQSPTQATHQSSSSKHIYPSGPRTFHSNCLEDNMKENISSLELQTHTWHQAGSFCIQQHCRWCSWRFAWVLGIGRGRKFMLSEHSLFLDDLWQFNFILTTLFPG